MFVQCIAPQSRLVYPRVTRALTQRCSRVARMAAARDYVHHTGCLNAALSLPTRTPEVAPFNAASLLHQGCAEFAADLREPALFAVDSKESRRGSPRRYRQQRRCTRARTAPLCTQTRRPKERSSVQRARFLFFFANRGGEKRLAAKDEENKSRFLLPIRPGNGAEDTIVSGAPSLRKSGPMRLRSRACMPSRWLRWTTSLDKGDTGPSNTPSLPSCSQRALGARSRSCIGNTLKQPEIYEWHVLVTLIGERLARNESRFLHGKLSSRLRGKHEDIKSNATQRGREGCRMKTRWMMGDMWNCGRNERISLVGAAQRQSSGPAVDKYNG